MYKPLVPLLCLALVACASGPAPTAPGDSAPVAVPAEETAAADGGERSTFDPAALYAEADAFFGAGAAGLADVLNRTFSEKGRPNAYIKGEEAGGAVAIGVRYGRGTLTMNDGSTYPVYWRGPSIGLELGGSAAKVFVLIYDLPEAADIYQRFAGVEGSLYFVGGVGATYNNAGDIGIAPIRVGVGWRQGVTFGYMQFSEEPTWNPF